MSIQSIHRNLNLAKKTPRVFVYVLSNPTNKAGTFTPGTKGKKAAEIFPEDGAVLISDFELQVNVTTARKINAGATRDVCAAARGEVETGFEVHPDYYGPLVPITAEGKNKGSLVPNNAITINMIQKGKEDKITRGVGQGEEEFVWAHNRKPCPTSGALIYADHTGMYIVD